MGTKLETLQAKLAKLQADIDAEHERERQEEAVAEIRDSFQTAIADVVAATQESTGKSLRDVGLGIWVAYPKDNPKGGLSISALAVGDDGLPKALKRSSNGHSNGNGNGNGKHYEYVLADGREFEKCEEAVNAMGIDTRDASGDLLEGKMYYTRHDRLPKELADAITKREKETEAEPSAK